jgi:hypothetical protein
MLTRLPAIGAAVLTGGLLLVALFVGLTFINWTPANAAKEVTLVYVGAENCAPCDSWQRDQAGVLRDSSEFPRLAYREVKSPSLFDVLEDRNWPEDLRAYRQAIGKGAGVPLWLVIADNQLVLQSSGLSQWQAAVLPKIKSLLR